MQPLKTSRCVAAPTHRKPMMRILIMRLKVDDRPRPPILRFRIIHLAYGDIPGAGIPHGHLDPSGLCVAFGLVLLHVLFGTKSLFNRVDGRGCGLLDALNGAFDRGGFRRRSRRRRVAEVVVMPRLDAVEGEPVGVWELGRSGGFGGGGQPDWEVGSAGVLRQETRETAGRERLRTGVNW